LRAFLIDGNPVQRIDLTPILSSPVLDVVSIPRDTEVYASSYFKDSLRKSLMLLSARIQWDDDIEPGEIPVIAAREKEVPELIQNMSALDIGKYPDREIGEIQTKEFESEVRALRGGEFVGNRLRFKVKIVNDTEFIINDVTTTIVSYPRDTLRLEGESIKVVSKIEPTGFRSPSFEFLPTQDCVKGSVMSVVSYVNMRGELKTINVEPYVVRAVCDLLVPETISPEEFALKVSELRHGGMTMKVDDWTPEEMHSKTLQILESSNFSEVTSKIGSVGEYVESKIQGWAKGKYTGKMIAIEVVITGKPGLRGATCKIQMSGEDEAMLMPAIDEVTSKLSAWLCPMCSAPLPPAVTDELRDGKSVSCPFCGVTISR
jgi:hypothetical protein